MTFKPLFHLAFHVDDLAEARRFYGTLLGCKEGRSTDTWVDFDFFGHQISLHKGAPFPSEATGKVGDHMVPMPHLGAVLPLTLWREVAGRLTEGGVDFIIPPTVRFEGQPGEQWTMFFRDPAGNPIEVKGFAEEAAVWAA
ncbi:VOC family protein [Acuticoccus yangtzensis]|uniref:VOC family protein n=1 Tax=Acuticoccus yangtzensis TaxID=1443441 RepID=UPI0009496BFD|nr:VOC family protein [Acuticoccus yangtzensis]ORE96095.1 glyoxalase/bleomycin resistance protein/dioxygenase [Stappia sp. 22II-S9-Z10]